MEINTGHDTVSFKSHLRDMGFLAHMQGEATEGFARGVMWLQRKVNQLPVT
jgi:hypothetical protein